MDQDKEKMQATGDESVQIKCEACGGVMRYSPSRENLKCIYCGHEQELDKTPIEVPTYRFDEWCDNEEARMDAPESEATREVKEVKCKQCGAVTELPEHVSSQKCPFCGTTLVLDDSSSRRFWKPGAMLPFKVEEKDARIKYKKWLSGKFFAPNGLRKNVAATSGFRGIYLPYWGYDADTHSNYIGERGVDHTREVERNGKRTMVTETEWHRVHGHVDYPFSNVLVPGSKTVPPTFARALSNWDLDSSVAYRKEFVSGFVTELYQRDFIESGEKAKGRMSMLIDSVIRSDIGGDKQRVTHVETDYEDFMFKLFLLPVWISSFRYNGKIYQFVVNGRTGQVSGEYPTSLWKVLFTILGVVGAIALAYYLMS